MQCMATNTNPTPAPTPQWELIDLAQVDSRFKSDKTAVVAQPEHGAEPHTPLADGRARIEQLESDLQTST